MIDAQPARAEIERVDDENDIAAPGQQLGVAAPVESIAVLPQGRGIVRRSEHLFVTPHVSAAVAVERDEAALPVLRPSERLP